MVQFNTTVQNCCLLNTVLFSFKSISSNRTPFMEIISCSLDIVPSYWAPKGVHGNWLPKYSLLLTALWPLPQCYLILNLALSSLFSWPPFLLWTDFSSALLSVRECLQTVN